MSKIRISRGRAAMATLYIAAGCMHFILPGLYQRILPPGLPAPTLLVAVSGIAEIAGGLGLLFEATRSAAACGLVVLLVAVFPANWNMATHPKLFPQIPPWILWARLPLQIPLAIWAARYIRHR